MIDIIVDTCTFDDMKAEYAKYLKFGQEDFLKHLKAFENDKVACEHEIIEMISKSFKEQNKGLSDELLVKSFFHTLKFYRSNIKSSKELIKLYKSEMRKLEDKISQGNGTLTDSIQVQNLLGLIDEQNSNIQKIDSKIGKITSKNYDVEAFKDLKRSYLKAREKVEARNLLILALNGTISLHVAPTSYTEIMKGFENPSKIDKPFMQEKYKQTMNLAKLTTVITIRDEKVKKIVKKVAKRYMQEPTNPNHSSIHQDKNSDGIYGDQKIMAEASLSGMIFITQNEKDFITDIKKEYFNDAIRQHIKQVAIKSEPFTSNSLPITCQEFLAKGRELKIIKGKAMDIVDPKLVRTGFKDVVEVKFKPKEKV